jgi:endonuclease/exonuclease/phosphatase family metal-dependent hydrolase
MNEIRSVARSEVTVMTQNLYFGAELTPIFRAASLPAMVDAVAQAWAQAQASMIDERAECIAGIIAEAEPDLLALQEAAQWSVGNASALVIKYDFLALILEGLYRRNAFYVPLAIGRNFDRIAPTGNSGECVRIIDRDAILLRIDDGARQVRPWNSEQGTFAARMAVTSPVIGSLEVPRGWLSVDVRVAGRDFRLINTHLESYSAKIQMAQVMVLLNGPAQTNLSVILAGDFNSNANQAASDRPSGDHAAIYDHLIASGMADAWVSVNPGNAGNTCCQHADLRNTEPSLAERIDLILTRGGITPIAAKLVAQGPDARTAAGLWPSDHAGIVATLHIG